MVDLDLAQIGPSVARVSTDVGPREIERDVGVAVCVWPMSAEFGPESSNLGWISTGLGSMSTQCGTTSAAERNWRAAEPGVTPWMRLGQPSIKLPLPTPTACSGAAAHIRLRDSYRCGVELGVRLCDSDRRGVELRPIWGPRDVDWEPRIRRARFGVELGGRTRRRVRGEIGGRILAALGPNSGASLLERAWGRHSGGRGRGEHSGGRSSMFLPNPGSERGRLREHGMDAFCSRCVTGQRLRMRARALAHARARARAGARVRVGGADGSGQTLPKSVGRFRPIPEPKLDRCLRILARIRRSLARFGPTLVHSGRSAFSTTRCCGVATVGPPTSRR